MISCLLAAVANACRSGFPGGFCLGGVIVGAIGAVLSLYVRARACAVVLNAWVEHDQQLRRIEGLRVRAIGAVLRLEAPGGTVGNTAQAADRSGIKEIVDQLDQIARLAIQEQAAAPVAREADHTERIVVGTSEQASNGQASEEQPGLEQTGVRADQKESSKEKMGRAS